MKNTFFLIIGGIVFITACTNINQNSNLIPFAEDGKWGFVNENGEIVAQPQYEEARTYSEGFSAVKLNDKWGFINTNGSEIATPRYEDVGSFHEGLAAVKQNNFWGYIDGEGKEVIAPNQYSMAGDFSEGFARVSLNQKFGFINKRGEIKIEFKYDYAWDFSDGLAKVFQNQRYGYINKKGEETIPVKYDFVGKFIEGKALAEQSRHWKLINRKGEEISSLEFEYIWHADESGYYKVLKDEQFGFINSSGEDVILPSYDNAGDFVDGLAVVKKNGYFGVIDRDGRYIIPAKYSNIKELSAAISRERDDFSQPEDFVNISLFGNKHTGLMIVTEPPGEPRPPIEIGNNGNKQSYIRLGNQLWMTEDMKENTSGSVSFSRQFPSEIQKTGRYYNWFAAQSVCPEGWRLPAKDDWEELIQYLDGPYSAYNYLTEGALTSLNFKNAGLYKNQTGFLNRNEFGYYWTSTEDYFSPDKSYCIWLNKYENAVLTFISNKEIYRNVRCMRDVNSIDIITSTK